MIDIRDRVSCILGDITTCEVDAIVNAANTTLLGGGGVDGAIHRVAGPELLKECKTLGGCPTGQVKMTKGYKLKAKFILHAVGPVWRGGENDEDTLLRNCYLNSLKMVHENKFHSVAFPAISTGIYAFPIERACQIAVSTIAEFINNHEDPQEILLVCFNSDTFNTYKRLLGID